MNHIMNALTQLQNDDYDAATGTFKNTIDMGWSSDISVKYKEFMLQKFVNADGTITEAGKKYFGDAMKKDFTTLTLEEIDILSEMLLRVSEEDSIYLLDLGYCVVLDKAKYGVDKMGTNFVNGNILGASDSFVLVLAVAKNKIDNQLKINAINFMIKVEESSKNGTLVEKLNKFNTAEMNGDSILHKKSILLQSVFHVVSNFEYIQDMKGLSSRVIFSNFAYIDLIFAATGLTGSKSMIKSKDYGVNAAANSGINDAVLDRIETNQQLAWAVGLLGYIPVIGTPISTGLTISDFLENTGVISSASTAVDELKDVRDGIWQQHAKKLTPAKDNRDTLELGDLASLLGLHVYSINGSTYYDLTNASAIKLAEFNKALQKANPDPSLGNGDVVLKDNTTLDKFKEHVSSFEKRYGIDIQLKTENDCVTFILPELTIDDMQDYEKVQIIMNYIHI